MALAVVQKRYLDLGNSKGVIVGITFDSSYPTGGEDLTAAQLGLSQVDALIEAGVGSAGYNFRFVSGKLLAYNGTTEIANATNLSTVAPDFLAIGS